MNTSLVQGEKGNSLGRGSRTVYAKEENDESAQEFWGIFFF